MNIHDKLILKISTAMLSDNTSFPVFQVKFHSLMFSKMLSVQQNVAFGLQLASVFNNLSFRCYQIR